MDRNFPDWLRAYLQYTTHLEAPLEFHLWTGIATIAGALRGKCWLDMGYFKWKPNFFIVFVAPPGIANKSTTSGVGMDLLRKVPGVHFGPDSVTWQALTQSFSENVEQVRFGESFLPMSCITIAASELGTFLNFHDREMIDVLVDLWDGRQIPWTRRTKLGGEEVIPNPWINIIAGTTPSWIMNNMPEYAIGGGFTSRSVFIYADTKHKLVAYPQLQVPGDFLDTQNKLVQDLQRIAALKGEFRLSPEAYAIGKEWYEAHWNSTPEHLKEGTLQGYSARKQTHIHKLAMILSAATRDDMIITPQEIDGAIMLLGAIEENMRKVFSAITDDVDVRAMAIFLSELKAQAPKIEKPQLFRKLSGRLSFKVFNDCVAAALFGGTAQERVLGDKTYLIPLYPEDQAQTSTESRQKVVDTFFGG